MVCMQMSECECVRACKSVCAHLHARDSVSASEFVTACMCLCRCPCAPVCLCVCVCAPTRFSVVAAMNRMYGFEGEVTAKHSKHMYECFVELFTVLPLAFTLNDKVFVTHGECFE